MLRRAPGPGRAPTVRSSGIAWVVSTVGISTTQLLARLGGGGVGPASARRARATAGHNGRHSAAAGAGVGGRAGHSTHQHHIRHQAPRYCSGAAVHWPAFRFAYRGNARLNAGAFSFAGNAHLSQVNNQYYSYHIIRSQSLSTIYTQRYTHACHRAVNAFRASVATFTMQHNRQRRTAAHINACAVKSSLSPGQSARNNLPFVSRAWTPAGSAFTHCRATPSLPTPAHCSILINAAGAGSRNAIGRSSLAGTINLSRESSNFAQCSLPLQVQR